MEWMERLVPWLREPEQRQRHGRVDDWHFPEERVKGLDAQHELRIRAFVEAVSLKIRCVGGVVN